MLHPGKKCDGAEIDVAYDDFKKDKIEFARCGNCKIPVEKIEGCNKVSCTQCKHDTCWHCKANITGLGYSHFDPIGNGIVSFIKGRSSCALWVHE